MKTNLFMALAFAFLMLFAACTEEKIIYVEKENGIEVLPGEGVIKISLSNDLQTKAARPIGSSEAANNVNRIKFSFISGNLEVSSGVEIEGAYDSQGKKLSDFSVAATDSSILILPDDNTDKDFSVKFKSLPDPGSYAIIAYGYNCVDGNGFPYTRTIATDNSPRYFKCSGISTDGVEEIFAGYCIRKNASSGEENRFISINQYKMFSEEVSVTITRQVAGLMAYLCNVPASIDNQSVDKITISTPAKMGGFIFPASILDEDEDYNGIDFSQTDVDLLTFTIKDHNDGEDSKGYYIFNKNAADGKKFLLADGMDADDFTNLKCKDNTLFGSCFLLPYSGHMSFTSVTGYDDKTTLYLTYYTKVDDGSNYTKIKSVRLKNSNQSYSELDYDILCNHFYSVGGKTDVETTEDDNPLDISDETGYVDVFLTINDTWDETLDLIK